MTDAVLGIDLGTSGVKVALLDRAGRTLSRGHAPYPTAHPRAGWLEQDPEDWWSASRAAVGASLRAAPQARVAGIGLSGHMSALVLAKADGTAVGPCLLLADARGRQEISALPTDLRDALRERSGNIPSEVFSVGKLLWVRDHEPARYAAADHVLSPKDFLRMRLTGVAGAERTDAGNSLLLTEDRTGWDTGLLERAGLRPGLFPPVLEPSEVAGKLTPVAAEALGLEPGAPVVAGASDMACSALGCGAVPEDVLAVTIGTAAQVLRRVPDVRPEVVGTVTYHPHAVPGALYAMGSILGGGLALSWAAHVLAPGAELADLVELAAAAPAGASGVLFVPTLVGAGTPWWEPTARGAWVGLSPSVERAHLLRAVLEGVAFDIRASVDILDDTWGASGQVRFGGGGSRSRLWAQIVASALGREVRPLVEPDASVVGAAALAAVGVGWYAGPSEAASALVRVREPVLPDPADQTVYARLYPLQRAAYRALREVDAGLAAPQGAASRPIGGPR